MLLPITGVLRGRSQKRPATMGLTVEIGYDSGIYLLALLASGSSGLVGRVHILLDTESRYGYCHNPCCTSERPPLPAPPYAVGLLDPVMSQWTAEDITTAE